MDTGPAPFADFRNLTARGNSTDDAGNEYYGCHRRSQGYLNLKNPTPGKVYYWGTKRLFETHYASEGWVATKDVRPAPSLPGMPQTTPLDGTITTPGGSILMEMPEELAAERRREKQEVALAHLNDDGRRKHEAEGYSIQERAAYYAPQGNNHNPYQVLPGHGITYTPF